MTKVNAAIVGWGTVGADLAYEPLQSGHIEPRWTTGVDPDSLGIDRPGERCRRRLVGGREDPPIEVAVRPAELAEAKQEVAAGVWAPAAGEGDEERHGQ